MSTTAGLERAADCALEFAAIPDARWRPVQPCGGSLKFDQIVVEALPKLIDRDE